MFIKKKRVIVFISLSLILIYLLYFRAISGEDLFSQQKNLFTNILIQDNTGDKALVDLPLTKEESGKFLSCLKKAAFKPEHKIFESTKYQISDRSYRLTGIINDDKCSFYSLIFWKEGYCFFFESKRIEGDNYQTNHRTFIVDKESLKKIISMFESYIGNR